MHWEADDSEIGRLHIDAFSCQMRPLWNDCDKNDQMRLRTFPPLGFNVIPIFEHLPKCLFPIWEVIYEQRERVFHRDGETLLKGLLHPV